MFSAQKGFSQTNGAGAGGHGQCVPAFAVAAASDFAGGIASLNFLFCADGRQDLRKAPKGRQSCTAFACRRKGRSGEANTSGTSLFKGIQARPQNSGLRSPELRKPTLRKFGTSSRRTIRSGHPNLFVSLKIKSRNWNTFPNDAHPFLKTN